MLVGPGREDRPGGAAAARRTSTIWASSRTTPAASRGRLGRVPAAVRAERGDALHQPDQDARVHGGREAGRQHAGPRRVPLYGDAVAIADEPRGVHRRLRATRSPRTPSSARCASRACGATSQRTSWDATARAIREQIAALIEAADAGARSASPRARCAADGAPASTEPLRVHSGGKAPASTVRSLVVGAGPTGLAAAYHLGERRAAARARTRRVGGWCRSIDDNGFTFDYAGHIMFSNDPYVLDAVRHAARRQRALAEPRGVDLQQGRLHALSVPGRRCTACRRRC